MSAAVYHGMCNLRCHFEFKRSKVKAKWPDRAKIQNMTDVQSSHLTEILPHKMSREEEKVHCEEAHLLCSL